MHRMPRVLLILAALAAFMVLLPMAYLLIRAFTGNADVVELILTRPATWQTAGTTIALAVSVAATTIAVGVPLAWLVTRARIRMRRTIAVALILPLAVPSFVGAYAWVSLFPGMSGFGAAWLVLSLATVPYVILPSAAALTAADPAHEEIARTLGNGPFRAFLRGTLPQISPAVGGGALLAALYVMSDFGAVSLLRVDTLSRGIYMAYQASFDRTAAAVLALLLAAFALAIVAVEQRVRGKAARWRVAQGAARKPIAVELGRWKAPAYLLVGVVVVGGLGVPVAASVDQYLVGASAAINLAPLAQAFATTVGYAVAGTLAALLLAVPIGILAGRFPNRTSGLIERGSYLGHALPGVVVGLAIVFLGTRLVPGIYQTVFLLAFAYAVLFVPKAEAAIRGSIAMVPPVLEDVARTLGNSRTSAFVRVTARLSAPGIGAGAVLVLLTVMKELPATLMLRPTGHDTLATRMWALTDLGQYAAAAPYSLTLIAIGIIPAAVLAWPMVAHRSRSTAVVGSELGDRQTMADATQDRRW